MLEGFAPRAQAAEWAGRVDAWRRRYGLHIATAVVFAGSLLLAMAATTAALQTLVP